MTAQLARPPRATRDVLAWSESIVDPAMRAAVDTLGPPLRHIAGYHLGWHDEHGHPSGVAGGKAIRPALALLAAETVGGSAHDAVPGAVAVELAHNFSLIHDDVMDGDETRRHRPAVWRVFGVRAAILTGDALLALAHEVLATMPHQMSTTAVTRLAAAMRDLLCGQQSDLSFARRTDVRLVECLAMVKHKTAALMGVSCELGALLGGATPARVDHLRVFGHQLGVAFQLIDDLLGVCGDLHLRDCPLSTQETTRAMAMIERAGGRAWVERQVDKRLALALDLLRAVEPTERPGAELTALARLITHRDH